MSCKLWKQAWAADQIDFHQMQVNPLLQTYWPSLALPADAKVFVPLCGKSLDMAWLLSQHCRIVGVEVSPIAVAAFFAANQQIPQPSRQGKLTRWQTDQVDIFCGDYFDLGAAELADVTAVYDHAAMQAFGPALRKRYVSHLANILPSACPVLLLSTGYPEVGDAENSFVIDDEILALYQTRFSIELLHGEAGFETHAGHEQAGTQRTEEKVYLLHTKGRKQISEQVA